MTKIMKSSLSIILFTSISFALAMDNPQQEQEIDSMFQHLESSNMQRIEREKNHASAQLKERRRTGLYLCAIGFCWGLTALRIFLETQKKQSCTFFLEIENSQLCTLLNLGYTTIATVCLGYGIDRCFSAVILDNNNYRPVGLCARIKNKLF